MRGKKKTYIGIRIFFYKSPKKNGKTKEKSDCLRGSSKDRQKLRLKGAGLLFSLKLFGLMAHTVEQFVNSELVVAEKDCSLKDVSRGRNVKRKKKTGKKFQVNDST